MNITTEEFNPASYDRALTLRTSFNSDVSKLVNAAERENSDIEVPMLLCPAYPHDGSNFTYKDGSKMTGDVSPTLHLFIREADRLLACLHQREFDLQRVHFKPMVCEIESDLPNVVKKFAAGDDAYFQSSVLATAIRSYEVLQNRYPFVQITASNFSQGIPGLTEDRSFIELVIDTLIAENELPDFLNNQLHYVAQNRNHMFQNLYGANTIEEFYSLAKRQMINYLAVSRGLAHTYRKGCVVFNVNTPNAKYVTANERLLRPVLRADSSVRLPIFYFF